MTVERSPAAECRAVVLRGPGDTRLELVPRPTPQPGELLLDLDCCGLCGTDLFKIHHHEGGWGSVLGHEVVGTVTAVGRGVDTFAIGDRVVTPHHVPCGRCHLCLVGNPTLCPVFRENLLSPGGFCESFVVGARAVGAAARRIPAWMSDETALFLEPAACVLRGIDRSGLPTPQRSSGHDLSALVVGAGSMGLLHLLLLRALYPEITVVVSDPLTERRRLASRLGASLALAPEELDSAPSEDLSTPGFDAVFDTVGQPAALRQALTLTREGATLVLFAHGRPGEDLVLELNSLFRSERRLVGTYSGGPDEQRRIWSLLAEKRLDPSPLITHRLPLSRFAEGVELATGRAALKVLFHPDEASESATA